MLSTTDTCGVLRAELLPDERSRSSPVTPRAPYVVPALEPLGEWRALTLQQSVCIGEGCALLGPLKSRAFG